MEWESYFYKRILDRGYDYYLDGCVEDLRITSNRIKAVVYGTHPYHVEIKLNGNRIIGMSCDCPYDIIVSTWQLFYMTGNKMRLIQS